MTTKKKLSLKISVHTSDQRYDKIKCVIILLMFQKRKGSGFLKHRIKSKRKKKGRSKEGAEDRAVWSVDKSEK